jgi:hypothetical protein
LAPAIHAKTRVRSLRRWSSSDFYRKFITRRFLPRAVIAFDEAEKKAYKTAIALPRSLAIERQREIFLRVSRVIGILDAMSRIDRGTTAIAWKIKVRVPEPKRMSGEDYR